MRRFALLVSHPRGGEGSELLRYAEADSLKMEAVLLDLAGFREEEIIRLRAPSGDEVISALSRIEARIRQLDGEALLLFYYSGHAASGQLHLGEERLDMARLRRFLHSSHARMRIAFLDACQSGAITRLKGGRRAPSFVVDVEPSRASRGFVLITSSNEDEASQESEELRGSFFTHYLVSGLRGAADRSRDGRVSLDEAYSFAYNRTVAHTVGTRGGTQHPTYTYDLQGNGSLTLSRLKGLSALLFPASGQGRYLVYDRGRDMVVGEVDKDHGDRHRLALSPGRYIIKKRTQGHLLLQSLELASKEQRLVKELDFERVAFEDDLTKGPSWLRTRREQKQSLGFSARLGYQSFFDTATRESLFHPGKLLGFRLDAQNWVSVGLSVHLDLAFGQEQGEIQLESYGLQQPVEYSLSLGGLGLTWDRWLGESLLQFGPRLTALYARRSFPDLPFQDLFTLSPGLSLGWRWQLSELLIGLEARVHYLQYATESEDRSLGFGEAYLSVGYAP